MTTLPLLVVILPAALLAASVGLLAFALRGRRVDDHPVCRRCGFDLFGKPAGSTACAECGADLTRTRATRVGRRERRRGLTWAATPLLFLSVGWLGLSGWQGARKTVWIQHKPDWWLMRDVDRGGPASRDAALAELARRVGNRSLPDERANPLIDRAMAHQADASQPWVPGWGQIIESAHAAGRLSNERWKLYTSQALTFSLEVVGPVRRGERVRGRLLRGPDRVAAARFQVEVEWDFNVALGGRTWKRHSYTNSTAPGGFTYSDVLTLDVPAPPAARGGTPPLPGAAQGALATMDFAPKDLVDVAVGPQEVGVTLVVRPVPPPAGVFTSLAVALLRDKNLGKRALDVKGQWALLPPDADVPRPPTRPAVRQALKAEGFEYDPDRRGGSLIGWLLCDDAPVDLAYDLIIRPAGGSGGGDNTREWRGGDGVFFHRYTRSEHWIDVAIPSGLTADKVDVVLRPNPRHAPGDVKDVWAEEVVIRDVPVRRPK